MKTKNKIIVLFTLLLGVAMVSCEGSFDFNKEQYKKVVYIMGGNNPFKIFDRTVLDLQDPSDSIMYITVGVGGTVNPKKDITVFIEPADSLFNAYNKSNFDIKTEEFAQILKPKFYTLTSTKAVIKAGTSTAKIPVVLRNLEQLSPDTTYFLNYKIASVDNYEISEVHHQALYQIYYKNSWANTKRAPIYSVTARIINGSDTTRLSASPKVFPLTANSIRTVVGKRKFETLEEINDNSFVIEIDKDPFYETDKIKLHNVHIKKYKNLEVIQENPTDPKNLYNNTFTNEKRQISPGVYLYFKIFNLRFKFKDGNTYKLIEEELKIQYNPTEE